MTDDMQTRRMLLPAVLGLLALAGCAGHHRSDQAVAPDLPPMLRVENDNTSDMKVYLIRGGQRVRIGTANALGVTMLKLPQTVVNGITQLRFLLVPIGGNRPELSEEITVNPGEEIVLRVLPG
jgi:hypothetical protein